ncbi:hypothetical protein ILUMI_16418 [Ignelater luminosus]|uniref:Uncharacterized protein n=1 Tax=Ignelater luminosus TaxID=2038154 RepID=A0A8K0G2X3_IGNLU|nr:hypothetical protein ILUMI_16418 [Ignelater luminosus]
MRIGKIYVQKLKDYENKSRKDRTLYNQKIASTFHRTVVIEEHISLLNEPGSKYLRHVTPLSGSGESTAKSIITFPNETGINPEGLLAVRCDGIAVNTKKRNSPLQFLELEFSQPLQWLIRQLHMNKLPLRHLFEYLDGRTSGLKEYSGAIGKALEYYEKLPKDFITAPSVLETVSDNNIKMLIHDLKALWLEFPAFPWHTQLVEIYMKLVAEASSSALGPEARDEFKQPRICSRAILPRFNTKSEYNVEQ